MNISRIVISALGLCAWLCSCAAGTRDARAMIAADPNRSGGIYYAYPVTADEMPAAPAGYEPVFVSHYGRHGSRWLIKMWEYDEAIAALDSAARCGGLTPLGADVLGRLHVIERQARGNGGALSPVGERQHRGIAERLHDRFPALFGADSAEVVSYSSVEPRCIMSMAAFNERLRELNGSIALQRHASPGDMRFISYSNDEIKAVNRSDAPWWSELESWRDSVLDPGRLMASLFTDPAGVSNSRRLMWVLHDIAVDVQDVEPGVELLDIFTADELYNLWSALNYKMYYLHGNNPRTNAAGPRSASALLRHFVDDIDSALAGSYGNRRVATLRFGHDTALLRLLALMKVEGADAEIADAQDYADGWIDFTLTPMAANLQIILFTADGKEPLVLVRHNEKPAKLPLKSLNGGFYRWKEVREMFLNNLEK